MTRRAMHNVDSARGERGGLAKVTEGAQISAVNYRFEEQDMHLASNGRVCCERSCGMV
jgi:hypothetical protein